MIERKRSCSRARMSAFARSRSRARSWRSSKSSTDSRSFAAWYCAAKPISSSSRRTRSCAAASSSAACSTARRASSYDAARSPRAFRPSRSSSRSGLELALEHLEGSRSGGALRLGRGRVVDETARGVCQPLDGVGQARPLAELEHELAAGGAQRLEDTGEHAAQPRRAVGREQAQALRLAAGAELRERGLERLAAQHRALRVVELAEARIEPGRERIRLQQPVAETVDRRDPRAVELAREVAAVELERDARGCASAARPRRASCT